MIDFDNMKLRFDHVLVKYDNNEFSYGVVVKADYSSSHYLRKNVIVNTRPADVTIITDDYGTMTYVIAHKSRIVASWDSGLLP